MITVYDNKNECCGCTACENICPTKAIKMRPDEEGFLYPKIDTKLCIDCGLCRDVCDFQIGDKFFDNFDTPEVFAIKHKSNNVRKKSSSGGAFTAISDYVLSKKGIIYGVAYDIKFNVFHKRVVNHEGRNSMRGSKYVQSDLKGIFSQVKDDLQNERYVLFTGTPCQVAGLNNYLIKSKVNMSKLLTTDIICYGTPV